MEKLFVNIFEKALVCSLTNPGRTRFSGKNHVSYTRASRSGDRKQVLKVVKQGSSKTENSLIQDPANGKPTIFPGEGIAFFAQHESYE